MLDTDSESVNGRRRSNERQTRVALRVIIPNSAADLLNLPESFERIPLGPLER